MGNGLVHRQQQQQRRSGSERSGLEEGASAAAVLICRPAFLARYLLRGRGERRAAAVAGGGVTPTPIKAGSYHTHTRPWHKKKRQRRAMLLVVVENPVVLINFPRDNSLNRLSFPAGPPLSLSRSLYLGEFQYHYMVDDSAE